MTVEFAVVPVLVESKPKPPRRTAAPGISCHQCKNIKRGEELVHCTNTWPSRNAIDGKRVCRKKYCDKCMAKYHDGKEWSTCPGCRRVCTCANCERKQDSLSTEKKDVYCPGMLSEKTLAILQYLHIPTESLVVRQVQGIIAFEQQQYAALALVSLQQREEPIRVALAALEKQLIQQLLQIGALRAPNPPPMYRLGPCGPQTPSPM